MPFNKTMQYTEMTYNRLLVFETRSKQTRLKKKAVILKKFLLIKAFQLFQLLS